LKPGTSFGGRRVIAPPDFQKGKLNVINPLIFNNNFFLNNINQGFSSLLPPTFSHMKKSKMTGLNDALQLIYCIALKCIKTALNGIF